MVDRVQEMRVFSTLLRENPFSSRWPNIMLLRKFGRSNHGNSAGVGFLSQFLLAKNENIPAYSHTCLLTAYLSLYLGNEPSNNIRLNGQRELK